MRFKRKRQNERLNCWGQPMGTGPFGPLIGCRNCNRLGFANFNDDGNPDEDKRLYGFVCGRCGFLPQETRVVIATSLDELNEKFPDGPDQIKAAYSWLRLGSSSGNLLTDDDRESPW